MNPTHRPATPPPNRQVPPLHTPPRLTPLDFGAYADGVTDDTAALQAFVDYCGEHPDIHAGMPGTYLLAGTVRLPPRLIHLDS